MNKKNIYQYEDPVFYEYIDKFLNNLAKTMKLPLDWDDIKKYFQDSVNDYETLKRVHIIRDKYNENKFILLEDKSWDSDWLIVCARCMDDEKKDVEKFYVDFFNDWLVRNKSTYPLKNSTENLYNTEKDRYNNILNEFNIDKL